MNVAEETERRTFVGITSTSRLSCVRSTAICSILMKGVWGAQVIKRQIAEGVKSRRVGFVCSGAPARAHSEIQTLEGETVRAYPLLFHPPEQHGNQPTRSPSFPRISHPHPSHTLL